MRSGGNGWGADRRAILKGTMLAVGGGAAAAGLSGSAAAALAAGREARQDEIVAGSGEAIVETRAGKVAGYIREGIFAFKGMPYGDSTAGGNRFMPPRPPKPWSGVRSSRQYGLVAPQDKGTGRLNDEEAFLFQWNDSVEGEDCLRVNVWTPGINDNRRRPVMVWLHGGGFAAGSGHDLPAFDGHNLAHRGDVVVVTLNHRLNILGFLDLSQHGERYAASGNVGMLDIVAALEWVRDNIAAFGGDPGRVTIFGQSGGGAKVSTLMGMPAARGLFHRAIVQSGSFSLSNTQTKSRRLADLVLAELGIGSSDLVRLETVPYADLRRASEAVLAKANRPAGPVFDVRRISENLGFGPVVDGSTLPATPFGPAAPAITADVPMIIGSTLNEFATGINHPEFEQMTEAELRERLAATYPGRGEAVLAAFRKRTPNAKPCDLWSRIASAPVRGSAIAQASAKAALGGAPAWVYWFTWQTAVLDGRPRAFHCAEIPFAFDNIDLCANMTGGGERARLMASRVADAWIAFARTGNPSHRGLPGWTQYSQASPATMILDDQPRLEIGIDQEEQASIARSAAAPPNASSG